MTGAGGLMPEQVWDSRAVAERGLYPGRPTGFGDAAGVGACRIHQAGQELGARTTLRSARGRLATLPWQSPGKHARDLGAALSARHTRRRAGADGLPARAGKCISALTGGSERPMSRPPTAAWACTLRNCPAPRWTRGNAWSSPSTGPRTRPGQDATTRCEWSRRSSHLRRRTAMKSPISDALVLFGATGDLAYKKIFPALQALVRAGQLDVPVIGVALSGWDLEQVARARARQPRRHTGGVDDARSRQLCELLRYVDGDYRDDGDLRSPRRDTRTARAAAALPGDPAEHVPRPWSKGWIAIDSTRSGARVVVEKPFGRDLASARYAQPGPAAVFDEPARSSASITTSARSRCRTCCTSASPTPSSSRCGTGTSSRACRSPWPRVRRRGPRAAVRGGRARCAT